MIEDVIPVAIVEIKNLYSAAAGNNVNNRINDIVAMATNLAATFAGPARKPYKPLLGLLMFVEKTDQTTRPRRWGGSADGASVLDRQRRGC